MKSIFFVLTAGLFVILSFITRFSVMENLSLVMLFYFFVDFLDNLGKRIVILDLIILLAIFSCLVVPVIFYHKYTADNPLARLWVKFMSIDSDSYYSFMLPATITMIIGLRVPLYKKKLEGVDMRSYLTNVRAHLEKYPNLGRILIGIGLCTGFLLPIVPTALYQVFYFTLHLTYVGVFYSLYSPGKGKRLFIPLVIFLMLAQTIITGMFGEFIYILALSLILIMIGVKVSFVRKLVLAVAGIFLIVIIQSVKAEYRAYSWRGGGADPVYFGQLVAENMANPFGFLDERKIFAFSVRMNQGWLVAWTMKRVPDIVPYANGETIWLSVAASLVPRFLWPDKPEAGGRANMKRFLGYDTRTVSMNIGPMGEAYGNFGRYGGIIYMFFYGLFFNFILSKILVVSQKRPTLILWLPYLFLYTVNVETDLVTTMNFVLKGVFFVWVVFRFFKTFLRIDL